jgi:trimethylamine--corrinoid protein Co-methyltransferase
MGLSLPFFAPLGAEDLKRIDQTSRRILNKIGIRVHDADAFEILKNAGADADPDNQIVRFDEDWLDETLGHAPSGFVLYCRDGNNDIRLGAGEVNFANGGRVFQILDLGTGGYRPTMLRDIIHTAKLVDRLKHIQFYIVSCQGHDIDPQHYHLNDFYHALNHTSKHVMGGCNSIEGARQMWQLASMIAGGDENLREKPFVSVITNPISPLTIETNALSILRFCCTRGIPVTCAPAPISGATAPATLAGTLAQMHAESLAGVAISQVFAPGAKVLYGAVPTVMDLRKVEFTIGSVEMAMMNAAAVQLAKLYKLPIYGSGGVTDAKRPDIQAGAEKTFSSLMVAMAGADCIHLAAGMLDSGNSISYEQYVIDNEIIGMIRRVLTGIRVDEDTLGLDVIEKVGPGGNYVMEDHTVEHMTKEFFYPELAVRSIFDIWEKEGRPSMMSRANATVNKILDEKQDGILDIKLISEIKKAFPDIMGI